MPDLDSLDSLRLHSSTAAGCAELHNITDPMLSCGESTRAGKSGGGAHVYTCIMHLVGVSGRCLPTRQDIFGCGALHAITVATIVHWLGACPFTTIGG